MASKSSGSSKTAKGDTPSDKTTMPPSGKDAQRKIPPPKPQSRRRRFGGKSSDDGSDLMIEIPKKVSFGNSTTPIQMLIGFILIVAGLLKVSTDMSVMFKPTPAMLKNAHRVKTSPVNRTKERREMIRNMIMKPIMQLLQEVDPDFFETEPAELCDIYLGPSSLPSSGWGFFAGKNYTEGESIQVEHESAVLLKPHSVLSNVKWDDSSVLVATRDIKGGEEFFLSWEDHISSPASSLTANVFPSDEHFVRADEYIRKARTQYFGVIDYEANAKPRKRKGGSSNARFNQRHGQNRKKDLYKKESAKDIENGLELWQSVVEAHDPIVAKLLPTKAFQLAFYHRRAEADKSLFSSSSRLGSLQNQTVKTLPRTGACASFFEWQPVQKASEETEPEESCATTPSYKQVVKREHGFVEGEILGIIPLLAMEEIPSKDTSSCLPLSSLSPNQKVVMCPLGNIYEHNPDRNVANAEFVWRNSTMTNLPLGVQALLTQSASTSMLSLVEEEKQREILLKVRNLSSLISSLIVWYIFDLTF